MSPQLVTGGRLTSRRIRRLEPMTVEIEVTPDNRGRLSVARQPFNITFEKEDIQTYNDRIIEALNRIQRHVQALGPDRESVRQVLPAGEACIEELRQIGRRAYTLLPEGVAAILSRQEDKAGDRRVGLDFIFPPAMSLIWECLYTGDYKGPIDIEKFWGFRYVMGRMYADAQTYDQVDLRRGVFAAAHSALVCSLDEIGRLGHKLQQIRERLQLELQLHQPEQILVDGSIDRDRLLALFQAHEFDYGVVHFACHCDNPNLHEMDVARAYLCLTAAAEEIQVTVEDFYLRASSGEQFLFHPLVFLNACYSSTPLQLQSLSLPHAIIRFGAGGVIATACTLPDNFASAFAEEFYNRLLDRYLSIPQTQGEMELQEALMTPMYVGEVLRETRRYFWDTYRNPLGLAYGLYAQSNQSLWLPD
jgi:hypothetical protein